MGGGTVTGLDGWWPFARFGWVVALLQVWMGGHTVTGFDGW